MRVLWFVLAFALLSRIQSGLCQTQPSKEDTKKVREVLELVAKYFEDRAIFQKMTNMELLDAADGFLRLRQAAESSLEEARQRLSTKLTTELFLSELKRQDRCEAYRLFLFRAYTPLHTAEGVRNLSAQEREHLWKTMRELAEVPQGRQGSDTIIRMVALGAYARVDYVHEETVRFVVNLVSDPDESIAREAIRYLEQWRDDRLVKGALIELLLSLRTNEQMLSSERTTGSLRAILYGKYDEEEKAKIVQAVAEIAERTKKPGMVFLECMWILGSINRVDALAKIVEIYEENKDKPFDEGGWRSETCKEGFDKAVSYMAKLMAEGSRSEKNLALRAAACCGRVSDEGRVMALLSTLQNISGAQDKELQLLAVEALISCGSRGGEIGKKVVQIFREIKRSETDEEVLNRIDWFLQGRK